MTGKSEGSGVITFKEFDDAVMALEQLDGFEIDGKPMKVGLAFSSPVSLDLINGSVTTEKGSLQCCLALLLHKMPLVLLGGAKTSFQLSPLQRNV